MPRAFNPHPEHPAVGFLLRMHADLAGRLQENKKQAQRLADDMRHVEAVIRMFDPAHDMQSIAVRRRQPNPWFKHGRAIQLVLDLLRTAQAPMTAREIAGKLFEARGVVDPPARELRTLVAAVAHSLKNKEGRGVKIVGEGMPARWTLATG